MKRPSVNFLAANWLIVISCIAFLHACKRDETVPELEESQSVNTPLTMEKEPEKDSLSANQQFIEEYRKFSSSPLVNPENFSFETGYGPLDELRASFDRDARTKITVKSWDNDGDCDRKLKTRSLNGRVLHYFKGDCGDYGFSNSEYYLENGELKLTREFWVRIGTWPDETQEANWEVREKIAVFREEQVVVRERAFITTNIMKSEVLLRKKPFSEQIFSNDSISLQIKSKLDSSLQ